MSRLLPIRPDLEHLRNEAKSLLKAHGDRDPSVCPLFRRLKRLANATDAEVLSAPVTLTEAQFVLALDYGFKNWDELRKRVLSTRPIEGSQAPPQPQALRLPDPPAGRSGNRFASAYHMALAYCGAPCDYDTVSGDSGLAFILQTDGKHTPYGADVKELDLGWWPLAPWGSKLRLDFLGRVYGVPLTRLPVVEGEYRSNAAQHFRKYHQAEIVESLQCGRPVVALADDIWVVTGIDEGTPPLLGQVSCDEVAQVKRLGQYPESVVVLGDMAQPMDRTKADAQAIAFACCLYNDRPGEGVSGRLLEEGKSTGKASFALWAALLRDGTRCGPAHYSANIVGCTKRNRRSVPPYLRQMALRHGSAVAGRLHAAADIYDEALAKLATADTSKQAFSAPAGREKLASLVDELAAMEAKAVREMEAAAKAMV